MNEPNLPELKQALLVTNDRILSLNRLLIESETASVNVSRKIRKLNPTTASYTKYLQYEAFVRSFESNYWTLYYDLQDRFNSLPDKYCVFTSDPHVSDIERRDTFSWAADQFELDLHHFLETSHRIPPDHNEYF